MQKPALSKLKSPLKALGLMILPILLLGAGAFGGYLYSRQTTPAPVVTSATPKDPYLDFLGEIYDKVKENYWDKISDDQLANLYKLGVEKLTGFPQNLKTKDKDGVRVMVGLAIKDFETEKKKKLTTDLAGIVLANLNPFGRNGLFTSEDETALKNTVQNVNPEKDLYQNLGVSKGASGEVIKEAYEKQVVALAPLKESSPEAKKKLEEIDYAYSVLTEKDQKERYDNNKAEPTVFAKVITPEIYHLYIKRFSPTTFDEFQKAADSVDQYPKLNTLILDLRGNIGGAIDLMPYFLGPFIGQNQYAYEYFHQGEYTPFKTQTGYLPALVRFKKVVVLIDGNSQSTAELMASVLKRYNVGVLVGTKTKGWGTIERVFDLKQQIDPTEKYSIYLVHTLTLRDDNKPVEGNGVEPTINITDKDWQQQLLAHFNYPLLFTAVADIWSKGLTEFN